MREALTDEPLTDRDALAPGQVDVPEAADAVAPRDDGDIRTRWFFSNWWIATGSLVTVAVVVLSRVAVGRYYSSVDALQLLDAMRDSALFLNAAIATGSATIIALMLTLMGLMQRARDEFQSAVHDRVRTIAWLSAISLLGAVLLLVALTIPVVESDEIATGWYRTLWWGFSGGIAVVSGLFVSVVLTLLVTIIGSVEALRPE